MPNRIHLLDEQVANQIAAGEVVERPASVLKELIENSLDAGATRIEVEIEGGGVQLIRVTDDGCGMSRDDALLCLERHATSKIRTSHDIGAIQTLGFRGEALPSIGSVSQIRIRTAESGAVAGTELFLSGGRIETVKETGTPSGTQIEVKRLFFNVPARRKFLRSPETEAAHLEQLLRLYALAYPAVGWSYRVDGRLIYQLSQTQITPRRVEDLMGHEFFSQLIPVDTSWECYSLKGWIGRAGVSRASKSDEIWFVNHRPVENRTLFHGIREGYQNALMKGRHPIAILFLELPVGLVDVNVHPAKREVRFRDEHGLRRFLVGAIRDVLQLSQAEPISVKSVSSTNATTTSSPLVKTEKTITSSTPTSAPVPAAKTTTSVDSSSVVAPLAQSTLELPMEKEAKVTTSSPKMSSATQPFGEMRLRVLGVVRQLYIVAESPSGLVLIDQHAAHERVLFEKVLKQKMAGNAESQMLLTPLSMTFSPKETDFIRTGIPALLASGLSIHEFGKNTFVIEAIPTFFPERGVENLIRDIITDLQGSGGETRSARKLSEEHVARTVCRMAIKANDRIRSIEIERLLEDLLACDLPYTCPHGRPTMILLTENELEKKFGRVT